MKRKRAAPLSPTKPTRRRRCRHAAALKKIEQRLSLLLLLVEHNLYKLRRYQRPR